MQGSAGRRLGVDHLGRASAIGGKRPQLPTAAAVARDPDLGRPRVPGGAAVVGGVRGQRRRIGAGDVLQTQAVAFARSTAAEEGDPVARRGPGGCACQRFQPGQRARLFAVGVGQPDLGVARAAGHEHRAPADAVDVGGAINGDRGDQPLGPARGPAQPRDAHLRAQQRIHEAAVGGQRRCTALQPHGHGLRTCPLPAHQHTVVLPRGGEDQILSVGSETQAMQAVQAHRRQAPDLTVERGFVQIAGAIGRVLPCKGKVLPIGGPGGLMVGHGRWRSRGQPPQASAVGGDQEQAARAIAFSTERDPAAVGRPVDAGSEQGRTSGQFASAVVGQPVDPQGATPAAGRCHVDERLAVRRPGQALHLAGVAADLPRQC